MNEKAKDESQLLDFLRGSVVFDDDSLALIAPGLSAYWRGDWIVCAHILIPQIEAALRRIYMSFESDIYRPDKGRGGHGGLLLKTMDDMLGDPRMEEILGPDIVFYFRRVLFTDPRGMNLRNNVCHGFLKSLAFGSEMCDRIVHALLVLGLSRRLSDESCEQDPEGVERE